MLAEGPEAPPGRSPGRRDGSEEGLRRERDEQEVGGVP